jgi:hypothetical protein
VVEVLHLSQRRAQPRVLRRHGRQLRIEQHHLRLQR